MVIACRWTHDTEMLGMELGVEIRSGKSCRATFAVYRDHVVCCRGRKRSITVMAPSRPELMKFR